MYEVKILKSTYISDFWVTFSMAHTSAAVFPDPFTNISYQVGQHACKVPFVPTLHCGRSEVRSRHIMAARMKSHISKPDATPLLIFPEGTCVNNEFILMFKKGAFEMGAVVGMIQRGVFTFTFYTKICLNK